MPKDPQLADRFARLVIAELADIHAIVQVVAEFAIADLAGKAGIKVEEATKIFEAKRKPRARRYTSDLLARLRLNG